MQTITGGVFCLRRSLVRSLIMCEGDGLMSKGLLGVVGIVLLALDTHVTEPIQEVMSLHMKLIYSQLVFRP